MEHKAIAEKMGLLITPVEDLKIVRERISQTKFRFADAGKNVAKSDLKRIEELVIPPAWEDVRIAPDQRQHIQAVGIDDKGRAQYIYHPRWVDVRDGVKARRLLTFGKALPLIRQQVAEDIQLPLRRKRAVLATAVKLIDEHLLRVGSEQYRSAGTRGASTLATKNVKAGKQKLTLQYTGKSGKDMKIALRDRRLRHNLRALKKRGTNRLFSIPNGNGGRRNLRACEINQYLTTAGKQSVSAKDFRTFAASAKALGLLISDTVADKSNPVTHTTKQVSEILRNTPAVAKSSYIHPSIISAFEDGRLRDLALAKRNRKGLSSDESCLMRFLEQGVVA